MANTMTIKMLDGKISVRRIDFIDSILYTPEYKMCHIWYNYEPAEFTKNYRTSIHTFDKPSFEALVHAWENGESVVLEEAPRPAGIDINQEMQHEMFKGSV